MSDASLHVLALSHMCSMTFRLARGLQMQPVASPAIPARAGGPKQCGTPLSARQLAAWEGAAGANLALLEANDKLEMWPIAWPKPASEEVTQAWERRKRPERIQPEGREVQCIVIIASGSWKCYNTQIGKSVGSTGGRGAFSLKVRTRSGKGF